MIRLLADDVAVLPLEDSNTTPSGLYLADQVKQRIDQGIVRYVGRNVTDVKVGDHVIFGGYDGEKVAIADEGVFIILPEPYIKAILDSPGPQLLPVAEITHILDNAIGKMLQEDTRKRGFEVNFLLSAATSRLREFFVTEVTDYVNSHGFEF